MAISYDPAAIERFFGSAGEIGNACPADDRVLFIEYAGPVLKYTIMLHLDAEAVGISGDTVRPFGGDSMYEICVPCSEIVEDTEGPDGYHPGQGCLWFYHGGKETPRHRRLALLKRPDGELKVWPEYPFPEGHRYSGERQAPQ